MDMENLNRLRKEFPEIADRTTLLGLFGATGTLAIADPYLASEAATQRICEQVHVGVDGLALWAAKANPGTCVAAIPSTAAGGR
jgi:hypothetical protein